MRSEPGTIRFLTIALLALLVGTLALFGAVPRYEPFGPDLLPDPPFVASLAPWKIQGPRERLEVLPDGGLRLRNDEPGRLVGVALRLPRPKSADMILLQARFSTENVRRGEAGWQVASIALAGVDGENRALWNRPHRLFSGTGSHESIERSVVFHLTDNVEGLLAAIGLARATGTLEVQDIRAFAVRESTLFATLRQALQVAWAIWGTGFVVCLLRNVRRPLIASALLLVGGTLGVGLLMPGEVRIRLSEQVASALPLMGFEPEQIAHFGLFATVAFLLRLTRLRDPVWVHLLGLAAFAALTEILQLFAVERGPSLDDWLTDAIGIALGLAAAQIWRQVERRRRFDRA